MMSDNNMTITLNGEKMLLTSTSSVTDLLAIEALLEQRCVVVVNEQIVSKSDWQTTQLSTGDKVDIISPISGG